MKEWKRITKKRIEENGGEIGENIKEEANTREEKRREQNRIEENRMEE